MHLSRPNAIDERTVFFLLLESSCRHHFSVLAYTFWLGCPSSLAFVTVLCVVMSTQWHYPSCFLPSGDLYHSHMSSFVRSLLVGIIQRRPHYEAYPCYRRRLCYTFCRYQTYYQFRLPCCYHRRRRHHHHQIGLQSFGWGRGW